MSSSADTPTGGATGRFPETHHSAILALRVGDHHEKERARAIIADVYWRPVYVYLRRRWNRETDDARDLTQGFFLQVLEKDFLASFDPQRAKFRTFLRVCLDRYVQREDASAAREKRGGGISFVPLDLGEIEQMVSGASTQSSPEDSFDVEWVRSLLALSTAELQKQCERAGRTKSYECFRLYDLEQDDASARPTYAELAVAIGTSVDDVTNQLAYARREFRRIVLNLLREMTASEEEFRDEARTLLGINLK